MCGGVNKKPEKFGGVQKSPGNLSRWALVPRRDGHGEGEGRGLPHFCRPWMWQSDLLNFIPFRHTSSTRVPNHRCASTTFRPVS